jgi:type VI protein secretion system component VasF
VGREVADRGGEVARSLPSLAQMGESAQTLATAAVPLQGAIERLGRIVDRLPGARSR